MGKDFSLGIWVEVQNDAGDKRLMASNTTSVSWKQSSSTFSRLRYVNKGQANTKENVDINTITYISLRLIGKMLLHCINIAACYNMIKNVFPLWLPPLIPLHDSNNTPPLQLSPDFSPISSTVSNDLLY